MSVLRDGFLVLTLAAWCCMAGANELDDVSAVPVDQIEHAKDLPQTLIVRVSKTDPHDIQVAHVQDRVAPGTILADLSFEKAALAGDTVTIAGGSNELDDASSTPAWSYKTNLVQGARTRAGGLRGPNSRVRYVQRGVRGYYRPYARYRYARPYYGNSGNYYPNNYGYYPPGYYNYGYNQSYDPGYQPDDYRGGDYAPTAPQYDFYGNVINGSAGYYPTYDYSDEYNGYGFAAAYPSNCYAPVTHACQTGCRGSCGGVCSGCANGITYAYPTYAYAGYQYNYAPYWGYSDANYTYHYCNWTY